MPWTNWGEQINREEMLGFVKQIRNRCDVILQFKPVDYLLYTLLEDIYEDSQAVATGYSAITEDDIPPILGVIVQSHKRPDMIIEPDIRCSDPYCICNRDKLADTDCTGDE